VIPTSVATTDQQLLLFAVTSCGTGGCTTGSPEPMWPTGSNAYGTNPGGGSPCTVLYAIGCTITDGTITWQGLGPWKTINVSVTGNSSTHNGFQEQNIDGSNFAFYAAGATDGVTFTGNTVTDAYGSGLGIINTNNTQVRFNNNNVTHIVKNNSHNMRRCFYIPDGTVATGDISNNSLNDCDYGLFTYQTTINHGNLSGLYALNEQFGSDIAIANYYTSSSMATLSMPVIYYGVTSTINPGAMTAGTCIVGTSIMINGVISGQGNAVATPLLPLLPPPPFPAYYWYALPTANNQVTVYICAVTDVTPPTATYAVRYTPMSF
jgi:hypothetical protein